MNVVIDTNIVFSAILSHKGKIHDLILNSESDFTFFTPSFLIEELEKCHEKILSLSGFSQTEVSFLKRTLFQHIEFIDPELIEKENWAKALEIASPIDEKDAPFIALAIQIKALLWTGDKKLVKGLKKQDIHWALNTNELIGKRN